MTYCLSATHNSHSRPLSSRPLPPQSRPFSLPSPVCRNSRIDTQQLGLGKLELWENRRRPERRARLPLTLFAVANVQAQGLGQRRLEGHGVALASGVHLEGCCSDLWTPILFLVVECDVRGRLGGGVMDGDPESGDRPQSRAGGNNE